MRKYYIVEFENANLNAVDEFDALYKAIDRCKLSIYSKYDLQLQMPVIVADKYVVLEIGIPDSVINEGFVIGRQLRSISDYLVHNFNNAYTSKKNYRLLRYTEIPKPDFENDRIDLNEINRFEIVTQVIALLNNIDSKSKEKIQKIQRILEE